MATQTYISRLEDSTGKMLDSERWSYKRPETILQKLSNGYSKYYDLYKRQLEQAATVAIYATPDGYHMEKMPVMRVPVSGLLDKSKMQ